MSSSSSTSPLAPRPFGFDTVFDGDRVIAPVRPKTAFSAEEVEAARAAGHAEGQRCAVARAEAEAAAAVSEATRAIRAGLAALTALAHEHRSASAELALACGRAVAGAALDAFPEAAVTAALAALAREIEAQPRLLVRAPPAGAERLAAALERAAEQAGFAGQLVVKPDPALAPAAFQFDWGEGRARFDPAAASDRMGEALAAALAAEGLHAEPPPLDPEFQP